MIFDLVHDFADALTAMPARHPRRRVLALLDEAVRRDVHFIDQHPTTLFQCLWNSCWWYDCPQAVRHEQRSPAEFARGLALTAWRWITRWVHAREEGIDRPPALFEVLEDWRVPPGIAHARRPLGASPSAPSRGTRQPTARRHPRPKICVARFSPDEQEIGAVAHEARPGSDAETVIHVFDTGSGRRLRSVAGLLAPAGAAAAQADWPLACAPLFRVVTSPEGRYRACAGRAFNRSARLDDTFSRTNARRQYADGRTHRLVTRG